MICVYKKKKRKLFSCNANPCVSRIKRYWLTLSRLSNNRRARVENLYAAAPTKNIFSLDSAYYFITFAHPPDRTPIHTHTHFIPVFFAPFFSHPLLSPFSLTFRAYIVRRERLYSAPREKRLCKLSREICRCCTCGFSSSCAALVNTCVCVSVYTQRRRRRLLGHLYALLVNRTPLPVTRSDASSAKTSARLILMIPVCVCFRACTALTFLYTFFCLFLEFLEH